MRILPNTEPIAIKTPENIWQRIIETEKECGFGLTQPKITHLKDFKPKLRRRRSETN